MTRVPPPGAAVERRFATGMPHAPEDAARKPQAAGIADELGIEADAVVGDGDRGAPVLVLGDANDHLRGVRVLAGVRHGLADRPGQRGDLLTGRLALELADDELHARSERARVGRDLLELGDELRRQRVGVHPAAQVARGAAGEVRDLLR